MMPTFDESAAENQQNWVDIIYAGFSENEIDHLECAADYYFEKARGKPYFITSPLILSVLKLYELDEYDEDEGKGDK